MVGVAEVLVLVLVDDEEEDEVDDEELLELEEDVGGVVAAIENIRFQGS